MFNHHKLKKRWGRGVKQISHALVNDKPDYPSSLRDFAWHKKKGNPYHAETANFLKFKIYFSLIVLAIVISCTILVFHPFFKIKTLNISGNQKISSKEITDTVLAGIDYHKFLILPADNYYLVDLKEIKELLKNKFFIDSVTIQKNFPDTLQIILTEKKGQLIYDNGREYLLLTADGELVEVLRKISEDEWSTDTKLTQIVTTTSSSLPTNTTNSIKIVHYPAVRDLTKDFGYLPIVYQEANNSDATNNETPKSLPSFVSQGVIVWFNKLKSEFNLSINYFELNKDSKTANIKMGEGWTLKIEFNNIEQQTKNLKYLLKNKINKNNLQYIDLRFPGRVYWQ